MIKINISKTLIFFLTTIVMFMGNLMSIHIIKNSNIVQNEWVVILIYAILLSVFIFRYKTYFIFTKDKLVFLIVWESFILSVFYSNLLHGEFNILEFILYSILIPLIFFSTNIRSIKSTIVFSYLVSLIPLLKVLQDNNTIGILFGLGATLFVAMIKNNSKDIFIYISIIVGSLLIFLTGSRGSLIAFFIISSIQILNIILKNNQSLISIISKELLILSFFFLVYFSFDKIKNLLFNKFDTTSNDITSGRIYVWRDLIDNKISTFGSDINYHALYNIRDAHNTFLQVLGDYGLISFVLFILIFIFIIYKIIRTNSLELLAFFGLYFILGVTGNLLFIDRNLIAVHILFFVHLGYLLNSRAPVKKHRKKSI